MQFSKTTFLLSIFLCIRFLPAAAQKGLFDSDTVLNINIRGNIRELLNDRGEDPKYHSFSLSYSSDDSTLSIPAQIKTRGHFRKLKSNCTYPPLMINVAKKTQTASSIFYNEDKLKLVMPCRGEEYVVREWLVYKLYNLITPQSFKARLVKVTLEDNPAKKRNFVYGILLEDEKRMAKRNKLISVEKLMLKPQYTDIETFLKMAVFEYMIGNTDWSVQYMQNVKLVATDSLSIPAVVPYDFDHSGLVDAPYAKPAEELGMSSVRQRRYRGYCITNMKMFDSVITLFNRLRKEIYDIYTSCQLLDAKYVKNTISYLDEFYNLINNPKKMEKEFGYPCDPLGTGNIVIKGMRED